MLLPFRLLYVVYALLTFVLLMMPVALWSLLMLPLGKIRGGNGVYAACIVWADCWFLLMGIRHRNQYLQPLDKKKACIFVANHISYLDAALLPKTFRQPLRPLGKVEMTKVPVFGFIYRNAIVTVDRSSTSNRAESVRQLKQMLQRGISVLVFPEGTFNTTGRPLKDFYDGAFRIAIETGAPIRPVLILDAYDRMNFRSIFSLNPGRSRAVFLEEIPVQDFMPHRISDLKELVYRRMEGALIHYKASWIEGEEREKRVV